MRHHGWNSQAVNNPNPACAKLDLKCRHNQTISLLLSLLSLTVVSVSNHAPSINQSLSSSSCTGTPGFNKVTPASSFTVLSYLYTQQDHFPSSLIQYSSFILLKPIFANASINITFFSFRCFSLTTNA